MLKNKLLFAIGFAASVVPIVSAIMLALAYNGAVAELEKMRGERTAVADVESFIYQRYPALDSATRRGHAEILVDSTCGEIAEGAVACFGGGMTNPPQEVRAYARRVVGGT